jgi:hypothetical protein
MPVAGLIQRLTLILGFRWLTALALHLWCRRPTATRLGG